MLEERDIQVRGYRLRLPLDLLLVATANPEDYTNRGRIITPLKDRFGAEIRTHYPLDLDDELALIAQEAVVAWSGPTLTPWCPAPPRDRRPVHPPGPRRARGRPAVRRVGPVRDRRGRDGRRLGGAAGRDHRRGAPVARVVDLPDHRRRGARQGRVRRSEEGREEEVLEHLLRRAIAETYRARLAGPICRPAGALRRRRPRRDR